ncbi:hypothetical protein [Streptomyces eurocidicus]|uniref:DNA-binding protein n=1 Tax=Streptomyces eurocidicus TaxID=66423 RepID=A0A7W8F4S8_STREU|nr:hypothetical protein [Streptomyces eurocidicus]MBB5121354.1 hypothetical protein [Streptomyces eurocidicus]MBF6055956.1 hypothetical protein [Streptomyces eurocidicus]
MLRHAIAPARFYSQVPNEIIRHPRLSSDAVRLLSWQLSLPEDADQPLSETAKRAGIKKTGFMRAKRELAAEGYLHEWRRQGADGRWSTTQLISNVPLPAERAVAVRDGRPTDGLPTAGGPEGRSVGRPQKNTEENISHPPSPAPVAVSEHAAGQAYVAGREDTNASRASGPDPVCAVPAPFVERGAQALAAVSHGERRLRLSGREVAALAPLAGDWLRRGSTVADIREALTQWLPDRVHSPAGLVRDRLTRKRPEAPTFAEQRAAERSTAVARSGPRVAEMRECAGEHVQPRLFRPVDGEALCPSCRCDRAGTEAPAAAEAAMRGGALVRDLLHAHRAEATV